MKITQSKLNFHLDFYEARAILLSRLGQHDQALIIYVHKIKDEKLAEEYDIIIEIHNYTFGNNISSSNYIMLITDIVSRTTLKLMIPQKMYLFHY